jgi:hypothetical protein
MDPSKDYRCPEADARWTATGHERPVFLDEHGTRRRWVLLAGALAGTLAALWLTALLAGAVGFSRLPPSYSPIRRASAHISSVAWSDRRRELIADTRRGAQPRRATASVPRDIDRA